MHNAKASSMRVRYSDSCLVQFAKAPLLGHVKTRLEPALGKKACLQLHGLLAEDQFSLHQAAAIANFELWCSAEHDFFNQLTQVSEIPCCVQQGKDLGARMHHAFVDRLTEYTNVIIIGSDCPAIDGDYIAQALDILNKGVPVVLGPATDGGYVLIGLNRVDGVLFEGVSWGADQVMSQTRQRLIKLGWQWQELTPLSDIDRPEDLKGIPSDEKLKCFSV
jgi:rSAM/selenodomain-associated transferase 1